MSFCELNYTHTKQSFVGGFEHYDKQVQGDRLVNDRPIFKNNLEKYEWLIQQQPQSEWLQEFKQSKEYKIYYE